MGSRTPEPQKLHIQTPCIPSTALSRAAGCNVFLKLENLQPSGSFKARGIGTMMYRAMLSKPAGQTTHFYCSSGGNAGLACATAAAILRRPCTIVVPETTPSHMIEKIRALGADVHQVGDNWSQADSHLRVKLLADDPGGVYVHPFDHAHVWDGVSTIVDELFAQTHLFLDRGADNAPPSSSGRIDALVCNCGGGGLLNGIMEGVENNCRLSPSSSPYATTKPSVLAVETVGADSLDASIRAGKITTLPAITSIATSLGASRVSERTFQWSQEADHLVNVVVTDAEAVMGVVKFVDDARMLVEVACGASIATAYNGALRKALGKGMSDEEWSRMNVVIIVCGGSNISLDLLSAYRESYCVEGVDEKVGRNKDIKSHRPEK